MIKLETRQKIYDTEENQARTTKFRYLKGILCIMFLLFTIRTAIPDDKDAAVFVSEPTDFYDRLLFDKIIKAVIQVESLGNTKAYNLKEEAAGAFQIRPIRLRDYNQRTGSNYTLEDCYNYEISKKIFLFYAKRIGYPHYELIARKWNGSGKATIAYWGKVKTHL